MEYKPRQTQICKWQFLAINTKLKYPELTISVQWLWLTVRSETLQNSLRILICVRSMCDKSAAPFKYQSYMWNSIFQGYFCATWLLPISHKTTFKGEFSVVNFVLYISSDFINRMAYSSNNWSQGQEHKEGHKKKQSTLS